MFDFVYHHFLYKATIIFDNLNKQKTQYREIFVFHLKRGYWIKRKLNILCFDLIIR